MRRDRVGTNGAAHGGHSSSGGRSEPARTLPKGPHNLTQEEVVASQSERIFAAIIDAVAEKGYARTSVADVLARARVSRLTFYQLFRDKEDCFVAAFEARASLLAQVLESIGQSAPSSDVLTRVDSILSTYLEVLRSDPATARALLIEVYAAGPRALQQRNRSMQQFVDVIVSAYGAQKGIFVTPEERRFAAQVLVGGVSSLVTGMVAEGRTDRLAELHAPLMTLFGKVQ